MRRNGGLSVEQGMTVGGVALALATAGFAYTAVEHNDGSPRIHGAEHMAIFAMPSRLREERLASGDADASRGLAVSEGDVVSPAIDYSPTATIREAEPAERHVRRVLKDRVVLDGARGPVELRPGEFLPGIGRLQEIRLARGRWVAVIVAEPAKNQSSR